MEDRKVSLPLMVRSSEDLQFVEEDNDTASDTEASTSLMQNAFLAPNQKQTFDVSSTCKSTNGELANSISFDDQLCGAVHKETEFTLSSPGHPSSYPSRGRCEWTVVHSHSTVCGLEFQFWAFDLEPSDNCTYDYLQVQGSERLCGRIPSGTVRFFKFTGNLTTITFVSDNQNSRMGFNITVKQLNSCNTPTEGKISQPFYFHCYSFICDGHFSKKDIFLRSPGFPANYSDDADCTYHINRFSKRVCALKVTFAHFRLEKSALCKSDYFAVDEKKFCGQLADATTETFPFQTESKLLRFHSDSSVTGPGFFAHIHQEECEQRSLAIVGEEECSRDYRETEFELQSPGYPENYKNEVRCRYSVARASKDVCELVVTVRDFKLQEGEVCENDYLQIAEERLCGTIESGMNRTYPFGDQDNIIMIFETDSTVPDKGFHISVLQRNCSSNETASGRRASSPSSSCDRTLTGSEDYTIRSPGFPDFVYPPDMDCRWTVLRSGSSTCELELVIHSLHIQVGDSCQYDFLEVDGHRFCGSTTAGNKRVFSFKTDRIVVHFHSDSVTQDRGFEVTLTQRECAAPTTTPSSLCDQYFESSQFVLLSPNHPADYDNGVDCRYVIGRLNDDICRLEFQFMRFDVESSSECEYDYLEIDGEKICGVIENTTRTFPFKDYEKQLTFHSDSGTSRPGFMIIVQQISCKSPPAGATSPKSKTCGTALSSSTFEVKSRNHPKNYDPHQNCEWNITKASRGVCALELTFLTFDVEASDGCQYDYLLLQGEKLCGIYPTNLKRVVPFEEQSISLQFHTDGATARPGFHIRGQQMDCAPLTGGRTAGKRRISECDMTFNNASGTFQSPSFPDAYPVSKRCVYRFEALPDRCRISLHFLEFGLEAENALCTKDFLIINGIKYCGPQLQGQKRTLTFYGHPRVINVTFFSDASGSGRGFYAVYKQLPCDPAAGRGPSRRTDTIPFRCDRLYASPAFVLLSPAHPAAYPPDSECRYTIRRLSVRVCRLRLSFRRFEVESSEGCEYDWLKVGEEKLCGTLPDGYTKLVEFKGDYQTIFTFHSDSANARPGFEIKVEQEECAPQTVETSSWKAEPVHVERRPFVETLHYPHIHPYDYEHLSDYPEIETLSHQRTLQVHRTTNCDRTFQRAEFEIRSPDFPLPYPAGVDCRYLVRRPSRNVCWVKLTFLRFDLAASEHCLHDYLSINGRRICGTLPDHEIRAYLFDSEEISLYFRSNSAHSHRGFLIRGEQLKCKPHVEKTPPPPPPPVVCDRTFHRDIFVIQSPNFPEVYPPNAECRFEIKKANRYICGLQLSTLAFDLENDAVCRKDYLQVGSEKLCGPIPTRTVRLISFTDETMIIKFRSDGKTQRPGFSILVQQTEDCPEIRRSSSTSESCSQEFRDESFLVQSPSFPEDYPPGATCEYLIRRASPGHCSIELRVLSFDVEEDAGKGLARCSGDRLELPRNYRLCGQLPKDHIEKIPFLPDEENILLTFHSDAASQRQGFSIQVRQIPDCPKNETGKDDYCGGVFKQSEFDLQSPGYPEEYPQGATCVYTVVKFSSEVCALELRFAHFEVGEGPDCKRDHLDIGHKTLCGTLPSGFTRDIPFDTQEIRFTFNSDWDSSKSGFSIKVKQKTECGTTWKPATPPIRMCDHCLRERRGHIISPDYPAPYPPDLSCSFRLVRVRTFCGVEVYFHDFNIAETPECEGDALIVAGERLCGDKLKGKSRKIDFPIGEADEVVLMFESDKDGSAPGFHAEYKQIPCRGYPWRQGHSQWSSPENGSDWTPRMQLSAERPILSFRASRSVRTVKG
ncbi:cubilin-like [Uloborus diversus]|uniref:cubilin-like n=1 Tax=Uloborus diversus TaxID=327109 RepID=UPI00240A2A78|nr:cubilin-like [Uloborus diversus]